MRQARTLRAWTQELLPDTALIVLGDFNSGQRFNQTTPDSEMGITRGLQTPSTSDDLFDVHQTLDASARRTHVGGKELDRILISPALRDATGLRFVRAETHRELAIRGQPDNTRDVAYDLPSHQRDVSDHFPLVAVFSTEGGGDTEPDGDQARLDAILRALEAAEEQINILKTELEAIKTMVNELRP